MPDLPRPPAENGSDAQHDLAARYSIRRKGSVYNIVGPEGRVFAKYRSASVVGPRWEELTETPWPYPSSAYEPGTRLWQLGLIDRSDVGKTELSPKPAKARRARVSLSDAPEPPTAAAENEKAAQSPTAKPRAELKPLKIPPQQLSLIDSAPASASPAPAAESASPAADKPAARRPASKPAEPAATPAAESAPPAAEKPAARRPASKPAEPAAAPAAESAPPAVEKPAARQPARKKSRAAGTASTPVLHAKSTVTAVITFTFPLALPAPRINLEEQTRQIQVLRRNPHLLFDPQMRATLQREVEYHRPYAQWAQTLLTMLARYDKRQQRIRAALDPQIILDRHIAWQEEQQRSASASS